MQRYFLVGQHYQCHGTLPFNQHAHDGKFKKKKKKDKKRKTSMWSDETVPRFSTTSRLYFFDLLNATSEQGTNHVASQRDNSIKTSCLWTKTKNSRNIRKATLLRALTFGWRPSAWILGWDQVAEDPASPLRKTMKGWSRDLKSKKSHQSLPSHHIWGNFNKFDANTRENKRGSEPHISDFSSWEAKPLNPAVSFPTASYY